LFAHGFVGGNGSGDRIGSGLRAPYSFFSFADRT
jgi:hypothetical protein